MNTQVIVTPEGERLVVIPEAEYRVLVEAAEDAADAEAVRRFEAALAAGEDELVPAEYVNRILDGENRVRVWREFRGLSSEETARRAGIRPDLLAEIENDDYPRETNVLIALATALKVDPEDLLPSPSETS